MAAFNPDQSPRDAWNRYQDHIQGLVRETLSRASGPSACEKHYEAVLDKMKNYFFYCFSQTFYTEDQTQSGSAKVRALAAKRQTPQSKVFWRKLSIPDMVDGAVEGFVMEERKRLWDAHKAIVLSNLQEALPASAREFAAYYTEFVLSKFVFRKFDAGFPEGRSADELEEWLTQLVKEVVATEIPKLINDKRELIDEELVRLATSGETHEAASVQLMERYSPKIKKLVAGIVYKHGLCPPSQDVPSHVEDTAQKVCLKITANLKSYGFDQPFEHWVAAICTNEALTGRRDAVGRGGLPRVFVSWEEFLQQVLSPVIRNTEHRDILKKAIDAYIKQGGRAKKSWDAIRLKWFEDLDVEEIAVRLHTTEGYVYKMFSHDYRQLRRISIDFGFSGTDL